MSDDYRPFRDIKGIEDLLLARDSVGANQSVDLAEPFYAEICAWVTLDASAEELLGEERGVFECDAWRLMLTEHGYLRFESDAPDAPEARSYVPANVVIDGRGVRVGVAISNSAWLLRGTEYAAETTRVAWVRLLAGPADGPLSRIGEASAWFAPELAPVPGTLTTGIGPGEVEAYNHFEADAIVTSSGRAADDLLPLVPCGSSFEPRWIDERTVEVFTRPEFIRSASYWVMLRTEEAENAPERLIVRTVHWGGANMTPTFFASADGEQWSRVTPERVMMVRDGAEWAAEFRWGDVAGGYLASSPFFGDRQREALIAWAGQIPGVDVREIGESVEGRPLHAIRLGDGPRGVAFVFGQHSPLEIMDGLMIEPMIRALLERRDLLAEATFVFVPTVNVDCAHYGGTGLNVNQRNLNRHWLVDLQPETRAVIDHIGGLHDEGVQFEFGIDFHAGGIFRNPVLMHMAEGEVALSEEAAEAQEPWRDALERHAGLRRVDGSGLGQMRRRATDWLQQELGAVAFCLELSTCSYYNPDEGRTRPFSPEALDAIAEGIVKACEELMV